MQKCGMFRPETTDRTLLFDRLGYDSIFCQGDFCKYKEAMEMS